MGYPDREFGVRVWEPLLTFKHRDKDVTIPMILHCTACRAQHIDKGIWTTKKHRTHKCEYCGCEWRPANVPTVGVSKI